MVNLYYTIPTKHKNAYDIARFNLIWRTNYVLSVLFVLLLSFFLLQGDFASFLLFISALIITGSSLIYLFKTHQYRPVYFFIASSGILLTAFSINFMPTVVHYGDIIWLLVAVTLAYFGLGNQTARFYALAALLVVVIHIYFSLNNNLIQIKPLSLIDRLVLMTELSIAISILFYIVYLYTSLYGVSETKVMNSNLELEKQNLLISKQNRDKELLLKEIHHRVKNNLQVISSLLNLQSYSIEDENAVSAIQEGQSRIKAMALLHQRLYQHADDFSKLDFRDYTEQLIHSVQQSYSKKNIQVAVTIAIQRIYLDIDTAVPLGLIMNELLSNAYKYAFHQDGQLKVQLDTISNGSYILTLKDSGPGLPDDTNMDQVNSLGLKLVKLLTRQIGGQLTYQYENGAKFVISFQDTITRKEYL